jgi:hypothetical protein
LPAGVSRALIGLPLMLSLKLHHHENTPQLFHRGRSLVIPLSFDIADCKRRPDHEGVFHATRDSDRTKRDPYGTRAKRTISCAQSKQRVVRD